MRVALSALLLISAIAPRAPSQAHVYTFDWDNVVPGTINYMAVGRAGDVDADGHPDVIVGKEAYSANPLSLDHAGSVRVYSGRTGTVLYTKYGMGYADDFGDAVDSAGDVNQDGFDDFVVGARENAGIGEDFNGYVQVFSGNDGSMLYTFEGEDYYDNFGYSAAAAGDVNGDGFADIIAGSVNGNAAQNYTGYVKVLSGKDGAELYTFHGEQKYDGFGNAVVGAGDVNLDGYPDLGVSNRQVGLFLPNGPGYVRVYSGVDGSTLHQFGSLRGTVAAGDANADGVPDILGTLPGAYLVTEGHAKVFSGTDGVLLHTFTGDDESEGFGLAADFAGDVDGDGHEDVVVGAPNDSTVGQFVGRVVVYSGKTGLLLFEILGTAGLGNGQGFGSSVAGLGDVNQDGRDDLAITATYADTGCVDCGAAYVYSGKPLTLSSDTHVVDLSPAAHKTQTLRLTAGSDHAGALYFLLGTTSGAKPGVDLGGLVLPLSVDDYTLFTLGNPNKPPLAGSLGFLSSSGTAIATFSIPVGAPGSLAGITAFHAYLLFGPSAITFTSNAVPVSIVP